MNEDLAEMPLEDEFVGDDQSAPEIVPVPRSLVPHLSESAILLDIDGTLVDLAPTPREVWVPPGLAKTLNRLLARTNGAMAASRRFSSLSIGGPSRGTGVLSGGRGRRPACRCPPSGAVGGKGGGGGGPAD